MDESRLDGATNYGRFLKPRVFFCDAGAGKLLPVAQNEWRFVDWAIDEQQPEARANAEEALYRQVLLEAQYRGYARCGGWLPQSAASRSSFKLMPRREEITMVKPLSPEFALDESQIAAADRFIYLDHV